MEMTVKNINTKLWSLQNFSGSRYSIGRIPPTPTPSITPTITLTPTLTMTPTLTATASITPTHTVTPNTSLTPTPTLTATRTVTVSPTVTITPTVTPSITPSPVFVTPGSPLILQTDTPSAPMGGAGTTGDENGLGGYLSIYGINFGLQSGLGTTTRVFIGGQEVANYRALIPAKVAAAGMPMNPPLQHIAVQVGALGTLVNGTTYPVTVVVSGVTSNSNITFMPNPGKVMWIDTVNGIDSGAHLGITQPWKTPQTVDGSGNLNGGMIMAANVAPGSQLIFRTGTYSTTGKDGMCWRYFRITGIPATGAVNTGGIHQTPYPGPILGNAIEAVTIFRPSGAQSCIGGNDSARGAETTPFGTTGYAYGITISNFVMNENAGAIDGPINNGSNSNAWRICNNELGPWPANVNGKAAGIAGDGSDVIVFANYIHDIQSPTTENHGVYLDGSNFGAGGTSGWAAARWDVGYNYVKNMLGGSGMQMYGAAAPPNTPFNGSKFHHNVIDTCAKYGINFADGTQSGVAYNNLILNTGSYALRTNTTGYQTSISFINNTCYNWMTASSGGGNSAFCNEWNLTTAGSYVELVSNIFIDGAARVNNGATYITNGGSDTVGAIQAKTNLYFDPQGHQTAGYSGDATGIYGDPKITTNWTDFRLQNTSPAINVGAVSTHLTITTDFNNNARPKPGNAKPSIGAFEAP